VEVKDNRMEGIVEVKGSEMGIYKEASNVTESKRAPLF